MFNQVTLIGHLGNDPELRTTPNGIAVCNFSLAVNEKVGQNEKTIWVRVTAWQKQAETVSRYLRKGSAVLVVGRLEEANAYTNRAGEPAATIEITGRLIKFLNGRGDNSDLPSDVDSENELPF